MARELKETLSYIRNISGFKPEIGLIMGTGLHQLASAITVECIIPYNEIPYFPVSTVESHKGQLIFGTIADRNIMAMQGRFHLYEGYTREDISFPVELMQAMGVKTLLISNAAGALNRTFKKGELMLISECVDLQNNIFIDPDNTTHKLSLFDSELGHIISKVAKNKETILHNGSYVAVQGPMLETRAEYRYLINNGIDAVGMSTVPEAIKARELGIRCLAVSVLTDECDPDHLHPVTLQEIIAVAQQADQTLSDLFEGLIREL